MTKLNYGCGERKIEEFINIDIEPSIKPDLVCDLRKDAFPFENESIDEIWCLHNIEHIEIHYWPHIFYEFNRVLKLDSTLVLAYPEFDICVKYFLENYRGMKHFWQATLYGRQLYLGDYHVTPVQSPVLSQHLNMSGFVDIKWAPDDIAEYNSFMKAKKGIVLNRENIIRKEVFGKSLVF